MRSEKGIPRTVEAALAFAGLGVAAPILIGAGLIIRATDRGPMFFRQTRVGRGGRPFSLLKLRTMRQANAGAEITASGDDRITPIGRVLRKTKLDELPELWNVVRGEMSLVGPRPEVPRYVDLQDPLWQEVLEERPGLTHPVTLALRNEEELLARVNGNAAEYYEHTLLPFKLKGCVEYARRRTWRSDVAVLAKTALAVVLPSRAPPPSLDDVKAT